MLGSLASRGERKKRSRVVREQFEKAAIFFVLCESNLNILKLVHKKQKMGSLFSICSTFYIQNNKNMFPLILIFQAPAGLKIKATPCVPDEQLRLLLR